MAKAGIIYIGTTDGLITVSDPGATGRWRRVGHTLQPYAIPAIAAHDALTLLVAATGVGIQRTTDGSMSWQPVLAHDIHALALQPGTPPTIYAATIGALWRSTATGQTWEPCPTFTPTPSPSTTPPPVHILIIPSLDTTAQPYTLLVTQADQLWISHTAATDWQRDPFTPPGPITGLAVAPRRPNQLFLTAASQVYRTNEPGEWVSTAPAPDNHIFTGPLTVLEGKQAIVLAAIHDAAGMGGLIRSDDDGATWHMAALPMEVQGSITTIAPVAHNRDMAWAGTTTGHLLSTTDRGRTWQIVRADLPPIRSLAPVRLA